MFLNSSNAITTGVSTYKTAENMETFKKSDVSGFGPLSTGAIVNFSTSKSIFKGDTDVCKKAPNQSDNSPMEHCGRCDSKGTVSPTIEPCEHPPQIKEVTCETVTNKLELKKDTSCRIPETTKKQDFCHRTECCPTNKDGAIEDLLMIIKSWFSFLKARECCPEPDTKRKQKLHVVPSCKSRQDTIGEKQVKVEISKCPTLKPKEAQDKIMEAEKHTMGGNCPEPPNTEKCPKVRMPGCRIPECTSCSKQMKITRKEIECKKVPAPKPSFSECSKELLAPPKFTECNRPTAVNINSKSDIVKPGNSVCDMYLQKNKIKMSKKSCENIKLQQTDSLKSENAECKIPKQDLLQESTICQETSGEPNLFYRLLNKKSKLPECQEKDSCETQNEVMDKCKKIHSQVEKNVCEAPKEVQECEKNQSSSQNIKCQTGKRSSNTCKDKTEELLKVGVFDSTKEAKKTQDMLMTSTSASVKEDEKKCPEAIRVDGIHIPLEVSPLKSKKTSECSTIETDAIKESCKQSSSSEATKTAKSASSSLESLKNDEPHSKKIMVCSGNVQIQKRSTSTSPVGLHQHVNCNIDNKNILPYSGFEMDIHSEINVKPPSPINKKSSLHRIPLEKKVDQKKLKIREMSDINTIYNESTAVLTNKIGSEISPEKSYQTKTSEQKLNSDASYLSYVKKFPGIVGKAVMSDIWSYCQNDIPAHSILKVPEPVHPKTNPKLDSPYLFESPVFQANIEGECEENEAVKMELQPCSSGK
ncbi:hypothetical protein L9F63_025598, partial [Diploptera punctata]